jgi:hypothetical protein
MGTLLRFLLNWLGFKRVVRAYLSPVSKTIDSLPVAKNRRWFWGGLLHLLPVFVVLGLLFFLRSSELTRSPREVMALLLASFWAWVGPVLVWDYEKYVLPQFARDSKRVVAGRKQYDLIMRSVYKNVYALKFCRYFTPIWMLFVIAGFLAADQFVHGFGIHGYKDYFWWFFFVGVGFFSFYTSLGFCFAHKTLHLTNLIAQARLDKDIYHPDGVFGLSFIGEFAFKTAAMFFSGWLFAPLILMSVSANTIGQYLASIQVLLLIIYFLFTVVYFFMPLYVIHSKIMKEKVIRTRELYRLVNIFSKSLESDQPEDMTKKYTFVKTIIDEVRSIPNWPLRVDTALKFTLTSIFIPVIAGTLSAILKANWGAP